MRIWPFRRKPRPRTIKKENLAKRPAVAARLQQARQSPIKKLLGRFRRSPEAGQPARVNFGESFRRARSRQQQQQRLRKVTGPIWTRIRLGVRLTTVIVIVVLIAVIGIFIFLTDKQVYLVKEIAVSGTQQISQEQILQELSAIQGKSMFSFSEYSIESQLLAKFPYIKVAQVRKLLPGKLTIDIEERYPVQAYINFSGIFLLDEERIVVNQLGLREIAPLTADELVVLSGFGDPNAHYVYENYLSRIEDEEERKNLKWEEVDIEDKKAALQSHRDDLILRVDTTLNNNLTALQGTEFTQLPRVMGYDSQVYDVGKSFPEYIFTNSQSIQRYLQRESLTYARMIWQSEFTLIVELVDGVRLLFTSTRSIQDQLLALETVRAQGDLSGVSQIDLRSEIVSVK